MKQRWLDQPERGSQTLLRFMARVTLGLGWHVGHLSLYPITAYFFVSSARARAASKAFLTRALGREVSLADIFRHYLTFASTILDRAFLLTGRLDGYRIEVRGLDLLKERIAAGQGCILLGSHLGSFEVLRALADQGCPVPVRALMYAENAARTSGVAAELNPGRFASVIRLGGSDALLRVRDALDAGELVGILGDRLARGDKLAHVDFLGRPAAFPQGPMVLASVLKAPVILFFGIHRGNRTYEIQFEPFAERIETSHRTRQAEVAAWVQRYATALETRCRAHPYNWFNFYDVWDAADASHHPARPARLSLGRAVLERCAARFRGAGRDRELDGAHGGSPGEPGRLS